LSSFSLLTFGFVIFWRQNIGKEVSRKMLMKLTPDVCLGLYSSSGGEAEINGHLISNNMAKARESLGLCPQHNMLFSDLTVYEHLMIFAMVKLF